MVPAGTLTIKFRLGSLTEETAREKGSRQDVGDPIEPAKARPHRSPAGGNLPAVAFGELDRETGVFNVGEIFSTFLNPKMRRRNEPAQRRSGVRA